MRWSRARPPRFGYVGEHGALIEVIVRAARGEDLVAGAPRLGWPFPENHLARASWHLLGVLMGARAAAGGGELCLDLLGHGLDAVEGLLLHGEGSRGPLEVAGFHKLLDGEGRVVEGVCVLPTILGDVRVFEAMGGLRGGVARGCRPRRRARGRLRHLGADVRLDLGRSEKRLLQLLLHQKCE